jgi:hypothetical protein
MSNRSCRFCGETDHNIRTCGLAKETTSLLQLFAENAKNDAKKIVENQLPFSAFEGSLLSVNFKMKDLSEEVKFYASNRYSDNLNAEGKIQEVLRKHSIDFSSYNDPYYISNAFTYTFGGEDLKIGFFVEKDFFEPQTNKKSVTMSAICQTVDFKSAEYIQKKLASSEDNVFKDIWYKLNIYTGLQDKCTNLEGQEGQVVYHFLQSVAKRLQDSARNKRIGQNRLFSVLVSTLGYSSVPLALDRMHGASGEWMHLQAPEIAVSWNETDLSQLTFTLTDNIKNELQLLLTDLVEKNLFEYAKSYIDNLEGTRYYYRRDQVIDSKTIKNFLQKNHHEVCHSDHFSSFQVEDSFMYKEESPASVIEGLQNSCKTTTVLLDSALTDITKMAHSGGGYAAAFEKGTILPHRIQFCLPEEVQPKPGAHYYGFRNASCYLGEVTQKENELSLGEIIVAILQSLVYSDREIKN